jgi:hypothetical protein
MLVAITVLTISAVIAICAVALWLDRKSIDEDV